MLGDSSNELVLYAPILNDARFVEFKIQYKTRDQSASSWSMIRTVVDSIPHGHEKYVASFPLGSSYQEKTPRYLRNLTIIDSRAPGTSRFKQEHGDVYFDLLSPLLQELGVGHVYVATSSSTSVAENAGSFSSSGTVVILGGDTSAHEFVNALQPVNSDLYEMRLVIVPTGTGNALATSLGLSSPLVAVQRLLLSQPSDFVPLSSFKVHFPLGNSISQLNAIVVASWGFHSALVADSDSSEIRERHRHNPNERFKEAARINLETVEQKYHGAVSGGAQFGPEFSYLLFTSVSYLENGFRISPAAEPPSSGRLHMIGIKPFDSVEAQKTELMELMQQVYDNGRHIDDPRITYTEVSSDVIVSVEDQPESMRRWCIDGHIVTCKPGDVRIGLPSSRCKGWQLKILAGWPSN